MSKSDKVLKDSPKESLRSSISSIESMKRHSRQNSSNGNPNARKERLMFELVVRRYYNQIMVGCGSTDCTHNLCASNHQSPIFTSEVAAVMAVQLGSNQSHTFCPRLSMPRSVSLSSLNIEDGPSKARNKEVYSKLESIPKPFLTSLFSFSSFTSIFQSKAPSESSSSSEEEGEDIVYAYESVTANLLHENNKLENYLFQVFSRLECLQASFLDEQQRLDVDRLEECYTKYTFQYQDTFTLALEVLVGKLIHRQIHDDDFLRLVVIVLLNPLMCSAGDTTKKFCLLLGRMKSKTNLVLMKQFGLLKCQSFVAIVSFLKTVLAYTGLEEKILVGAIKILSLLVHSNEKNKKCEISLFYSHELVGKLDFKLEYRKWIRTLDLDQITDFSLFNYGFLFDPIAKTRIMHIDAIVQMAREYEDACVNLALVLHAQRFLDDTKAMKRMEVGMKDSSNPYLVLELRRSFLMQDVMEQIVDKRKELKKPLKVRFVEGGEEGMDQGGVQKEFFQVVMDAFLDPIRGMFEYDEETRYSIIRRESVEAIQGFQVFGALFGLALYNGVMIKIAFPPFMYKKLLKEEILLEDVESAFPMLGKGLRSLLEWDEGDVEDIFMRTFEISYEQFGQIIHIPLIKGGGDILVTNNNRKLYVDLYIKHLTSTAIEDQFNAILTGFYEVCGGNVLAMCRPAELEKMVCGSNCEEGQFEGLEAGAKYDDGYSAHHTLIVWFWEIVHSMLLVDKKKLLEFVTASDRIPLKGLESLLFVIQRNGPDTDRLPSALTCFGRLLLPEYSTKVKLEERLMTAIDNSKGFGLV